jgi:hypothetical protein
VVRGPVDFCALARLPACCFGVGIGKTSIRG